MIELKNKNGKIVGIDENGNEVPISLGDANLDSVDASVLSTEQAVSEVSERSHGTSPAFPRQKEINSAFSLRPHSAVENPVITIDDVDDATKGTTNGVADPFMVFDGAAYHIFAEVLLDTSTSDYRIGHWTSHDGLDWTYDQIVLTESVSLAYPYTFKADGNWYMAPSQGGSGDLNLYQFDPFPTSLSVVSTPISPSWTHGDPTFVHLPDRSGEPWDSSSLTWDGTWYLFVIDLTNNQLRLFYSDTLTANGWMEHSGSPVTTDSKLYRVAGRPMVSPTHLDLWHRDGTTDVNDIVRATRLDTLSKSSVGTLQEWGSSPMLRGTEALNEAGTEAVHHTGLHHVDMVTDHHTGEPLFVVDGQGDPDGSGDVEYSLGIYEIGDRDPYSAVEKTTNQSVTSGSFTQVTFDKLDSNLGKGFDLSTDTFTTPRSGYYSINSVLTVDAASADVPFQALNRVNISGSDPARARHQLAAGGKTTLPARTEGKWIEAGTNITVEFYQNSGSSQTVVGEEQETYLEIKYEGQ